MNGEHMLHPEELLDDDEVFETDTNCTFVIGGASIMFYLAQ